MLPDLSGLDLNRSALTRVVAAVVEREGAFLICQRPAHKRHGGMWEFPGGKVDPAETTEEALARELIEELAVEVIRAGEILLRVADPGSEFVIEFVEAQILGEPVPLEHADIAWVRPAELLSYPLAPSDRVFATTLQQGT